MEVSDCVATALTRARQARLPSPWTKAVDFPDLAARASKKIEHWRAWLCGKQRKSTASGQGEGIKKSEPVHLRGLDAAFWMLHYSRVTSPLCGKPEPCYRRRSGILTRRSTYGSRPRSTRHATRSHGAGTPGPRGDSRVALPLPRVRQRIERQRHP